LKRNRQRRTREAQTRSLQSVKITKEIETTIAFISNIQKEPSNRAKWANSRLQKKPKRTSKIGQKPTFRELREEANESGDQSTKTRQQWQNADFIAASNRQKSTKVTERTSKHTPNAVQIAAHITAFIALKPGEDRI
jgi:hypothetical protein